MMMMGRKLFAKRSSEDSRSSKDEAETVSAACTNHTKLDHVSQQSFNLSNFVSFNNNNGKEQHLSHDSCKTIGKDGKGNEKICSEKLLAKGIDISLLTNNRKRSFERQHSGDITSSNPSSPNDKITTAKKGNSIDLADMFFPAEYVLPPMDYSRRRSSAHRVSYKKAIRKAGYNMNELGSATSGSPATTSNQQKARPCLTEVDWTENALPDHHIWSSTNAAGDICFVSEDYCQKSGPRKRCEACHIVIHEQCFHQFIKIGFACKATFRDANARNPKETMMTPHHWVHRRKQDGKCKHCAKSFEKRFGFRESSKIIAISCSWCKEAYHNKVTCFDMNKLREPCKLGLYAKSIIPPTWIVKCSKQKTLRNRSKKRKLPGGALKRKSTSKEYKQKNFVVKPIAQQAAFLMPLLIFINPKSGGRQGTKLLQLFRWFLNPRQVIDLSKENPKNAIDLFRKVPNLRILACGGDGTVGWILSILDKFNMPSPPPVGILPLGTGNDLSRTLNFGAGYADEPIRKIVQGVEEAKMVKLDRWKLTSVKNNDIVKLSEESSEHPHGDSSGEGTDKLPLNVLNNYFSIGSDAQVSFKFHESREAHPAKFTSRFGNKIFYARAGVFEYISCQSKNLFKHITVLCDGIDVTPKIRDLKPVCLLFLNIPRYSAGTLPWGNPNAGDYHIQRHDDEFIEVLAFSINQLGMLFVGGHGERLCQCRSAFIQTTKVFPMQVDGEPCKLNPSRIQLEFFNQANMLARCKRRSSVDGGHVRQEQIKIQINFIKKETFETHKGKKELLCYNAIPLLATVVLNHSTLDIVRSCLLLTLNEQEHGILEKWVFLDSTSRDKLYKIDKNQESRLIISDIISNDRHVYILNISDQRDTQFSNKQECFEKHRPRIQSEPISLQSQSSFSSSHPNVEVLNNQSKAIELIENSDPTSTYLDVVFEQPETGNTSTHTSSDPHKVNVQYLSYLSSEECFALSEDALVSCVADTRRSKSSHRISPPSSTHLAGDKSISTVFSTQLSLDESRPKLIATHQRSHSDINESSKMKFFGSEFNERSITQTDVQDDHLATVNLRHDHLGADNLRDNQLATGTEAEMKNMKVGKNGKVDKIEWNKIFVDSSKRGNFDLMKLALDHGVDACVRDHEGNTALHNAVRFSHLPLVEYLLERNSEIIDLVCVSRKQTPLHKAAWFGHLNICKKLVCAGASLDVKDYKYMTPIDRAKQSNSDELLDYLEKEKVKRKRPFHETDL